MTHFSFYVNKFMVRTGVTELTSLADSISLETHVASGKEIEVEKKTKSESKKKIPLNNLLVSSILNLKCTHRSTQLTKKNDE